MDPIAFNLGPISIRWYGLLIVAGILSATYLATYLARLRGKDPEFVWDALWLCVVLGIVGARLYHVLTVPPSMGVGRWYYFENPGKIFAIWEGGLGIYGAVAGGALGLYIVARRAKEDMLFWMDMMVPGVALAQGIGRWGNFINQELYGRPTNLPWAIFIAPENRLPGFEMYERFHPIFLYESVWNVATCAVLVYLVWRYRDKLAPGLITSLYLISYSIIRFLLDFVRLDNAAIGSVTIAQIVAVCAIAASSAFMVWRIRVHKTSLAAVGESEEPASTAE
jgi:phosphatidylglycerol:prolipoprotein diacylglycerol transferase